MSGALSISSGQLLRDRESVLTTTVSPWEQTSLQSSHLEIKIRASPKKSHMVFRPSSLYLVVHLSLHT